MVRLARSLKSLQTSRTSRLSSACKSPKIASQRPGSRSAQCSIDCVSSSLALLHLGLLICHKDDTYWELQASFIDCPCCQDLYFMRILATIAKSFKMIEDAFLESYFVPASRAILKFSQRPELRPFRSIASQDADASCMIQKYAADCSLRWPAKAPPVHRPTRSCWPLRTQRATGTLIYVSRQQVQSEVSKRFPHARRPDLMTGPISTASYSDNPTRCKSKKIRSPLK